MTNAAPLILSLVVFNLKLINHWMGFQINKLYYSFGICFVEEKHAMIRLIDCLVVESDPIIFSVK